LLSGTTRVSIVFDVIFAYLTSIAVNEFDEVGLIGGGSGITPLYQILTHALADKKNRTKFKLIFSNQTEKGVSRLWLNCIVWTDVI
jgi:hypothetical protein